MTTKTNRAIKTYTITIPGEPIAKERPRRNKYGAYYTPPKTQAAEELIAWHGKQVIKEPLVGEVSVVIYFYVRKMKSDIDNCLKLALDGLNKIVWKDDRQVEVIHVCRVKSATPRTVVYFKEGADYLWAIDDRAIKELS